MKKLLVNEVVPNWGLKVSVVPDKLYAVVSTVTICERLKTLNPSAKSSRLIDSENLNRLETRMSRFQIFGWRKVFRPVSGKRLPPPDPVSPPPPVGAPDTFPETLAEYGGPDVMLRIGARLNPLKIACAT